MATIKFRFSALYMEVDVSWNVHHELTKMLRYKLNELGKEISFFESVLNTNYFLDITFSATRKNAKLVIKGPVIYKESNAVEFVPFIPYVENMSSEDQVLYVFDSLEISLQRIFENYDSDFSGIPEAFQEVRSEFIGAKEKYTY